MGFDSTIDAIDWKLLELPWEAEGNKLVLSGKPAAAVRRLIEEEPGVFDRIAILVKTANYRLAQICVPGRRKPKTINVLASMAPDLNDKQVTENAMTQSQLSTTPATDREDFIWFGGMIVPELDYSLKLMRDSAEPMGLVLPFQGEGILKTLQLGINASSVKLFGFDQHSFEDMRAAVQRDTSGDWFEEDLELKRQLFRDAGNQFEQTARIKTKDGWFLMWFGWERISGSDCVIGRGRKESEVVQSPELLVAA